MRTSAGLLLYKRTGNELLIFLVHPGGPCWKGKEEGAWSIPKGEFTEGEDPLSTAIREFREETGQAIDGSFTMLEPVRQKGGKMVYAWALEGDADAANIVSNQFRQEYPYKSGKWITVPEVDKAAWLPLEKARVMINPAQTNFLDQLMEILSHEKAI